ncbi:MAG: type II toxin-antitoxin system prevent-host-death family antitoxin [Cyanobacteriota bacterium]
MQATNYSYARNNLKTLINKVCDDYEPLIITNKDNKNVVLISLEEYNALQEATFISSNKKDSEEILERMNDIKKGKFNKKDLL